MTRRWRFQGHHCPLVWFIITIFWDMLQQHPSKGQGTFCTPYKSSCMQKHPSMSMSYILNFSALIVLKTYISGRDSLQSHTIRTFVGVKFWDLRSLGWLPLLGNRLVSGSLHPSLALRVLLHERWLGGRYKLTHLALKLYEELLTECTFYVIVELLLHVSSI